MYNKNGMTFIELITVLAILSIISCIAVPCIASVNYRNQNMLLETSSKELLCDLRLAQEMARSEGVIYHVYFNGDENSYMIYSMRDMNSPVYKRRKLPKGIRFDNVRSTYSDNKISFNSRGKPLPRPCTISIINSIGQYRRITIKLITNYISIKDN